MSSPIEPQTIVSALTGERSSCSKCRRSATRSVKLVVGDWWTQSGGGICEEQDCLDHEIEQLWAGRISSLKHDVEIQVRAEWYRWKKWSRQQVAEDLLGRRDGTIFALMVLRQRFGMTINEGRQLLHEVASP